MMRLDPTGLLPGLAGLEEPDCPACATGWHTRCHRIPTWPRTATGSSWAPLPTRLMIARRRRPLWTR